MEPRAGTTLSFLVVLSTGLVGAFATGLETAGPFLDVDVVLLDAVVLVVFAGTAAGLTAGVAFAATFGTASLGFSVGLGFSAGLRLSAIVLGRPLLEIDSRAAFGIFSSETLVTGNTGRRAAGDCSASTVLSGFVLGLSDTAPAVESVASVGCLGDSGIGSKFLRAGLASWSREAMTGFSGNVEAGSASVSLLSRLREMLDSSLGFLRRPTRPSFSVMATNWVRTLESGRGEPVALASTGSVS